MEMLLQVRREDEVVIFIGYEGCLRNARDIQKVFGTFVNSDKLQSCRENCNLKQ
jgi:hypothetical protein